MSNSYGLGKQGKLSENSPNDSIFDLNHIEGDLGESQHRLSTIFATVQVGIFLIDAETHIIVDANPKAAAIIGFPREQIVGSLCHRFICHTENWQCPITDLGQSIDNAERKLLRADGECIAVVKTVAKLKLRGREHLVESFLDISDRKRMEEALKQSEERNHDLLENANDLIQSVDPNGFFLYVNRAWKETMGYTDEEIASRKVFNVISPACQNHCSLLFQQIMSGKSIPRVEVQFIAKDGRIVELEGSINCSFVDGKPVVTRGIFRDITERKVMERALQQSEERYRRLVEDAPVAIFVHSEGKFLYANREAVRLLSVGSQEELIGEQVVSFLDLDCREIGEELLNQLEAPDTAIPRVDLKLVRPDGSVIDVESVGTNISWQGMPAVQVVLRDITKRKQHDKDREEWNRKLELMVEEKTRHLKEAQAKLIQSEKMSTLGEVISGASHELNNPLAGILSALQMLRRSTLSHPIGPELVNSTDVLEDLESAAIRCQKIVVDLIRFSTQARCSFSLMDINQVLKDTLEITGEQYAEAGIKVSWCTDPALPAIEGDYVKLLEVFVNLLQNAKSALPHGGNLDITTRLVKKFAELPQVVIGIRDTGCGIPAQNIGKIFDPFFTTKPVGKGPGLGLTVSYGIIKRHGGDIDVRSTFGKGTEVIVTLPARQPKG
jgi:PAS domain S-box-containing protein